MEPDCRIPLPKKEGSKPPAQQVDRLHAWHQQDLHLFVSIGPGHPCSEAFASLSANLYMIPAALADAFPPRLNKFFSAE